MQKCCLFFMCGYFVVVLQVVVVVFKWTDVPYPELHFRQTASPQPLCFQADSLLTMTSGKDKF